MTLKSNFTSILKRYPQQCDFIQLHLCATYRKFSFRSKLMWTSTFAGYILGATGHFHCNFLLGLFSRIYRIATFLPLLPNIICAGYRNATWSCILYVFICLSIKNTQSGLVCFQKSNNAGPSTIRKFVK